MQTYKRRMLTLWLRSDSTLITNDVQLNVPAVSRAIAAARAQPQPAEQRVIALARSDTRQQIANAARRKGSARPLVTALVTWWHQGSAASLPKVLTRVAGVPYFTIRSRHTTHRTTVIALQNAGMQLLASENETIAHPRSLRLFSSLETAARRVVHAAFGIIWVSVAGQAGVESGGEAWWYVGAEIVQALKAGTGVHSLTALGRYGDVTKLWAGVDTLGYGWRREYQTDGLARALARGAHVDEERVATAAMLMSRGMQVDEFEEIEKNVAREANAVACLGLAVGACVSELHFRLDEVCAAAEEVVAGVGRVWIEPGGDGAMLMGVERERRPEAELARRLFRWVGSAAMAMGRAGGPEFDGGGDNGEAP